MSSGVGKNQEKEFFSTSRASSLNPPFFASGPAAAPANAPPDGYLPPSRHKTLLSTRPTATMRAAAALLALAALAGAPSLASAAPRYAEPTPVDGGQVVKVKLDFNIAKAAPDCFRELCVGGKSGEGRRGQAVVCAHACGSWWEVGGR